MLKKSFLLVQIITTSIFNFQLLFSNINYNNSNISTIDIPTIITFATLNRFICSILLVWYYLTVAIR